VTQLWMFFFIKDFLADWRRLQDKNA